MENSNLKILNRDAIKYIAMFTMLLNHVSLVFLERGTVVGEIFLDIGYFTMPVICYFLVEGYYHTRSKKRYAGRLFLFALLAQYPYYMALSQGEKWPGTLNMMFTLLLCFLILEVKTQVKGETLRFGCYMVLILATGFCDWPSMAAIYTLLFSFSYGSRQRTARAFFLAAALFALPMYLTNSMLFSQEKAVVLTLCAVLGVLLAAVVILYFYNGKQAVRGRTLSKWFFYVFYPAHLLIIGVIRKLVDVYGIL